MKKYKKKYRLKKRVKDEIFDILAMVAIALLVYFLSLLYVFLYY